VTTRRRKVASELLIPPGVDVERKGSEMRRFSSV
jgi:hypothetical protein